MQTVVTTTTETKTVTTTTTSSEKTIYDFFVLDRSGSMRSILDSTISGFNEYIAKSQALAKSNNIKSFASVLLFDDQFILLHDNVPVAEVAPLTRETFVPRNTTALNDAVARAITSLSTLLKGKESSDNIDVTITIFTDGEENSSQEYRGVGNPALAALVKKVQDECKWTVAYVGAGNKDLVNLAARSMGVVNVANYTANAADSTRMFASLSSSRDAKSMAFSAGIKTNVGYFDGADTGSN